MKPYRTILIIVYTAALTSAWWASALWATRENGLLAAPIVLTIGAILFLIGAVHNEA